MTCMNKIKLGCALEIKGLLIIVQKLIIVTGDVCYLLIISTLIQHN